MNEITNKLIALATIGLMISISLIIFFPIQNQAQPQNEKPMSQGTQILEGKITQNGDLFIILDKVPLQNQYEQITGTIHDPNMDLLIYSPEGGSTVLQIQSEGKITNLTIQTPPKEMTEYQFTVPLTKKTGTLNMSIQGVGYFNVPEQLIIPEPIPFFNSGELGFFGFITTITSFSILSSFGISLLILRKTRYFPPIQGIKLLVIIGGIIGIVISDYTTNYYLFIQQPWYYFEIPLIFLMTMIFLSYIPQPIKRGILIRFLDDRTKEEIYTDLMTIYCSDQPEPPIPKGWNYSGMEYIDKKSYLDFLKRLIGLHTYIIFKEGKLPDQIYTPRSIKPEYEKFSRFTRMKNRKKDTKDYDFGYLLSPKEEEKEEIKQEKINPTPEKEKGRKIKYFEVPLSGHHSTYIEQFLAGLKDIRIEGERISDMKEKLALRESQIMSGTYLNDLLIIDKLGEILDLRDLGKTPTPEQDRTNHQENSTETIKKGGEKNE